MRVGIAGVGFMAETHVTEYREMDIDIVGVASPSDPGAFVEEHELDCPAYTDVRTMITEGDLDFLDVSTPAHTHWPIVETAAAAGVDVFLEKPIAGSISDAEVIVEAVDDAGITLMVGHVLRFVPEYRRARELEVGEAGVARARRLSPFPDWGSNDWFEDRSKSGGIFVDLAIHDLDYLRWCWGKVERVFARRHRESDSEHGFVTLRFADGAVGYVEASWAQPGSRPFTTELEFAGDGGLVELSSEEGSSYREWIGDGVAVENPTAPNGYRRELQHFVDCLEAGEEPAVTGADAVASLRLALAAELSADRGEPVAVAEVGR